MATLFRSILVPHDFSDHATAALKMAAELARAHRGRLIVLHAVVPVYAVPGFPPGEQIAWVPPRELVGETRTRLESVVARALGRRGPRVTCRVVIGEPLQAILDAARAADSIVMATVGRTGLAHLLIGSVAEKVVRHAPVPVLVVRPAAARRAGGRGAARASRSGTRAARTGAGLARAPRRRRVRGSS